MRMDFDLCSQVAVIAREEAHEYHAILMWACLSALCLIVAFYAFRAVWHLLSVAQDKIRKGKLITVIGAIAIAVSAILYGGIGTGVGFVFTSESGLIDNGSFINYSNNTITAVWLYQPYVSGYKFKWFYSFKYGGEDKGPIPLPDANVTDCYAECQLTIPEGQSWESLIVTCYTMYVAPPQVWTNGVYHLSGVARALGDEIAIDPKFVTPGIVIKADLSDGGEVVLTPTNAPPSSTTTIMAIQAEEI